MTVAIYRYSAHKLCHDVLMLWWYVVPYYVLLWLSVFPRPPNAVGVRLLEHWRLERHPRLPGQVCHWLGQRCLRPHFHVPGEDTLQGVPQF